MTTSSTPRTVRNRARALGAGIAGLALTAPLALAPPAQALAGGSIAFLGTARAGATQCQNANVHYQYTVFPNRDDDPTGMPGDYFVVTVVDGNGALQEIYSRATSPEDPYSRVEVTDLGRIHPLTARPLTVSLYDVDSRPNPSGFESDAGYAWTLNNGRLLGTDTIDPGALPATAVGCAPVAVRQVTPAMAASVLPRKLRAKRTKPVVLVAVAYPGRRPPTGNVSVRVRKRTFVAPVVNGQARVPLRKLKKRGKTRFFVTYSGDTLNTPVGQVLTKRFR